MSEIPLSVEAPGVEGVQSVPPPARSAGLVRQIAAYVPALVIPGVVNFSALALYTRLLGAEQFGRYAYVMAVVVTAKMVAFEWLRLGLFRFFQGAQRDGRLPALLSTALSGFVLACALTSLVWAAALGLLPMDARLRADLWLGLLLLLVWALFEQVLQINRAAIAPVRYGLLSGSRAVLCLGGALGLMLVLGRDESHLIAGLILGTAVAALADLPRWARQIHPRLVQRALAADLLRYSMPFVAIFSLDFVPSLSNRFLLQHFKGSEAVGLFAAGYDLANQTIMLLFSILNVAAYPLVVKALERVGKEAAQQQLRQYAIVFFGLALPAGAGLALVARPLSLVLGEAFREAAGALMPWVAVSTLIVGAKAFYFDLAFQLGLRTHLQIWTVAAAAVLNIALNLWWIPLYGVMGAVWATCGAYAVALAVSMGLGRRVFHLPLPASQLGRIALATLLMAAAMLLMPRGWTGWIALGAKIGLGAAVYGAAIWVADVGDIRRRAARALGPLAGAFGARNK